MPSPLGAISEAERTRQIRLRTQGLLAARFGLMDHRKTRRQRTYELVVAKGGSKLRAADPTKPESVGIREGQFSGSSARLDALTKTINGRAGPRASIRRG